MTVRWGQTSVAIKISNTAISNKNTVIFSVVFLHEQKYLEITSGLVSETWGWVVITKM